MTRVLARLRYTHARLWRRDGTYRLAVLLGPPPLLAAGLTALAWYAPSLIPAPPPTAPPWATVTVPRPTDSTDPPRAVPPRAPLPASGTPTGLVPGWQGSISPVEVSPSLNANVLPTRLGSFLLDTPGIDLARVVAASPGTGQYVGVANSNLVVHQAGVYAITLQLRRTDGERATCLQRLVFANQRLVSDLQLDRPGPATMTYEPVPFQLQPGIYPISLAFGCWNDQREKGTGTLDVMIRRPGEDALRPAQPDELLRPAVAGP